MKPYVSLSYGRFSCALSSLLFFFCFLFSAHAEAPMAKTQAPGFYRMMLGQFEITALYDGSLGLDKKLLRNASDADVQDLFNNMLISDSKAPTSVNAYLINTGSKLVLVDTGTAKLFGPGLGQVLKNLKASGYDPAQVDAVFITHMHGDHIGGLIDDAGKPVFTKADVYASKAECDFFLSEAVAKKAPADMQPFFKMARDMAAPYIAAHKWKNFEDGVLPIPGIKAIPIAGHTPGHTAFEVSSGNEKLIIIGDMVHVAAVQFTRPDVAIEFDSDGKNAVSVRQTLFSSAAEQKVLIAGMHLPFPGIGKIRPDGNKGYIWVPVQFLQGWQ